MDLRVQSVGFGRLFVWAAFSRHKLVRNHPPSSLVQTSTSAALGFREECRRTVCRGMQRPSSLWGGSALHQILLCVVLSYLETEQMDQTVRLYTSHDVRRESRAETGTLCARTWGREPQKQSAGEPRKKRKLLSVWYRETEWCGDSFVDSQCSCCSRGEPGVNPAPPYLEQQHNTKVNAFLLHNITRLYYSLRGIFVSCLQYTIYNMQYDLLLLLN